MIFKRYQGVLEHALSKVDFSVGIGIYMLPSNLNLNIGKMQRYNNKILVSNTDMKIGSNRDINKDNKKLSVTPPDVSKIVIPTVRHDIKMLTEKHNDEKLVIPLLIVGGWANCLSFLVENKCHHYYSQSVVPW